MQSDVKWKIIEDQVPTKYPIELKDIYLYHQTFPETNTYLTKARQIIRSIMYQGDP